MTNNKSKFSDKIEGKHYVTCKICGFMGKTLVSHLHAKHNMSADEYKKRFKSSTFSEDSLKIFSEKITGDKNPAKGHGGKFSAYSKHFLYKDRYDPSALAKKAAETAKNNNNLNTTIDYYLARGLSKDEAELKLSDRQTTFSLDKCIKKYGAEKGTEIWEKRQEKWQSTLNSKSPEEIQSINAKKISKIGPISSAENELFEILKDAYPNIKKQHRLAVPNSKHNYFYDISLDNKIVEYNGDYWHCNPSKYKATDKVKRNNTLVAVSEVWQKDKKKIETAENLGYTVMIVWEADFKKNRKEVIKRCIDFLTQ